MGLKTIVRKQLEKIVGRFGYILVKSHKDIKGMSFVLNPLEQNMPFCEQDFKERNSEIVTINWIIPELGPGSGGHLDIFRAISILNTYGSKNRVYIYGGAPDVSSLKLKNLVKEYYGIDILEEEIFASVEKMSYADATIATSWKTAYPVREFGNTISKFYFVQDFEPYFFPKGSEYALAENTYKFGFRGITAGDWLAQKLKEEYGMETMPFHFSYEREIYHPEKKQDEVNRVFFYARPFTERRAFELGVLALEQLAKEIPDLEVVCAGQKLDDYDYKFKYIDMGIMPIQELSKVYSQCDMCLVLSMTNLSLLPMEIMASNSVVVSNKGDNNAWLLNEDNAVLVDNDPKSIAEQMLYYMQNKQELQKQREKGLSFVNSFTWESEFERVYQFIKESVINDIQEMEK